MADELNVVGSEGEADAQAAEDAEWEAALKDFAGDKLTTIETTTQETTQDEQTDTTTTTTTQTTSAPETTTSTTTLDLNETVEQKTEREKREADEAAKTDDGNSEDEENGDSLQARRAARQTTRETQREVATVKTKVIAELYPDRVTELRDGQDKPIKTIEDVMTYINPLTKSVEHPEGRLFNEEEAAQWLLNATQDLNKQVESQDKRAEVVAEIQVDLADQIGTMDYEYGELFKAMPKLRDELIKQYGKTLVRDPKSGIVTGMPLTLDEFAETQLQPYVKLGESLEASKTAEEQAKKEAADAKKKLRRIDRSDIFGHDTSTDDMDNDDKEWANAAKAYYGK